MILTHAHALCPAHDQRDQELLEVQQLEEPGEMSLCLVLSLVLVDSVEADLEAALYLGQNVLENKTVVIASSKTIIDHTAYVSI